MLRPGCSSTTTFGSLRIASRSAGFGYGITWHSPFCSFAQRTDASGVIEKMRSSIFALPPQNCGNAL